MVSLRNAAAYPFAERVGGGGVSSNSYSGAVHGVVRSGGCDEGNGDAEGHTACC
jgi:hypothetical protein